MAVVENRFVCDLSKPVQAQALKGNVFSLDNLGSRLSVLIYDNGQPATISGSVTANCILPDGSTVNVNGGLTTENGGSKAYVDIPQSCLLIPGILKIAIKCTSSSVITTLAAIVANVYMTKTDNVITPSQQIITDWNAEISAAIATQNAAIANQDTKINDLKSAFEKNTKPLYKQFIDLSTRTNGKYWNSSVGKSSAGDYCTIEPFYVDAGTYYFTGLTSNFCWFKAASTETVTNISDLKSGDVVTISVSGYVYISGNFNTYNPNNWKFTDFDLSSFTGLTLPFGFMSDIITKKKIDDLTNNTDNGFYDLYYSLRKLPKQFINPNKKNSDKYWQSAGNMESNTNYTAIDAFHIDAGNYWANGFDLSYSWYLPDVGGSATNLSEYTLTNGHFEFSAGTIFISANTNYYPLANWVFTNFNLAGYVGEEIPFGFIGPVNIDRIRDFVYQIYPKQFLDSDYTENKYWNNPTSQNGSNGWYAYNKRFHVDAGLYYTDAQLGFSWLLPDDGSSYIALSAFLVAENIINIKKAGVISISSKATDTVFANYVCSKGVEKQTGYEPGFVPQYKKVSDLRLEKYLIDNEYDVSDSNKVSRDGNVFTVASNDAGVNTSQFTTNSAKVRIKYDCTFAGTDTNIRLYLKIIKTGGSAEFIKYAERTAAGSFAGLIEFDAASMIVYDEAEKFQVLIWGNSGAVITVNNLVVYEADELKDSGYYKPRLDEMLLSLANGIEKVDSESKTRSGAILSDQNGNKHGLVINSNGQISSYPFIPTKYLVFGNSITCGYTDPLLGKFGMASTGFNKDWVYKVNSGVLAKNAEATYTRIYSSPFEHSETIQTAEAWMDEIEGNLTSDIDLVLIEMGDNVNTDTKLTVFEDSFPEFLSLIRTNCTHARIIVIGIWFNKPAVKRIMLENCKKYGCEFVDISGIRNSGTEATAGATIHYSDGTTGTIDAGAATHPGDTGMEAIGEAVLEAMDM